MISNSSQPLNKKLIKLSSRQAGKQTSEHPSGANIVGAKLTHNTRRYQVQRCYRSRYG